MKRYIFEKLKNRKGESIGEVLVALLISSLALVMLASMITSSSNMIKSSRIKIQEYYTANNVLETRPDAASGSGFVSTAIKLNINDTDAGTSVSYYKNDKAPSGTQVVSYKINE